MIEKSTLPIFTSYTLTGSYVTQSNPVAYYALNGAYQLSLHCFYTMGAAETGNSIQIKVELASPKSGLPTSSDWVQESSATVSGGTKTIVKIESSFAAVSAAGTADGFHIDIPAEGAEYFRVSVKETGVSANAGTATIRASLAGVLNN